MNLSKFKVKNYKMTRQSVVILIQPKFRKMIYIKIRKLTQPDWYLILYKPYSDNNNLSTMSIIPKVKTWSNNFHRSSRRIIKASHAKTFIPLKDASDLKINAISFMIRRFLEYGLLWKMFSKIFKRMGFWISKMVSIQLAIKTKLSNWRINMEDSKFNFNIPDPRITLDFVKIYWWANAKMKMRTPTIIIIMYNQHNNQVTINNSLTLI